MNHLQVNDLCVYNPTISLVSEKNKNIPRGIVRRALVEAVKANHWHFRHGAVIFYKSQIVTTAFNTCYKTHPQGSGFHKSHHAEMKAVLKAAKTNYPLHKCFLLVLRVNHLNQVKNSKPCKDCYNIIKKYGINIIWSI